MPNFFLVVSVGMTFVLMGSSCAPHQSFRFKKVHDCREETKENICKSNDIDRTSVNGRDRESFRAVQSVVVAFLAGEASLCGRNFIELKRTHAIVVPQKAQPPIASGLFTEVHHVPRSLRFVRIVHLYPMERPFRLGDYYGLRLRCEIFVEEKAVGRKAYKDLTPEERMFWSDVDVHDREVHDYWVIWRDSTTELLLFRPATPVPYF